VQPTPPSKAQVLQSIKELLERPLPAVPQHCTHCGALMQFVNTHFLLRGTALNWNVPLPFCPVCDTEIVQDLPSTETIH
jgi:hypothetical protein